DGQDFLQVIDAGDVARFARQACENSLSGCFNLAGPRLTWAEFLSLLGVREPVWIPLEFLRAHGLTEFDLPLYRRVGSPRSGLMHVANDRAVSAGLTLTST